MFQILQNLINFGGDWSTSYNGYIVQGCIALIILACIVTIDFIYKVFLAFVARKDK